eukprot:13677705-Alexandrium_andersonii.AAC.1
MGATSWLLWLNVPTPSSSAVPLSHPRQMGRTIAQASSRPRDTTAAGPPNHVMKSGTRERRRAVPDPRPSSHPH